MTTIRHVVDHKLRRPQEYLPVGDQLDAIFKGFLALREQGLSLPAETVAWLDHVAGVKERFAKATEAGDGRPAHEARGQPILPRGGPVAAKTPAIAPPKQPDPEPEPEAHEGPHPDEPDAPAKGTKRRPRRGK